MSHSRFPRRSRSRWSAMPSGTATGSSRTRRPRTRSRRSLAADTPQLVVAAASPHHLTAALIEECDRLGVPIGVVAASAVERRHASALGIIDTVDAASWDLLTPIEGARSVRGDPCTRPARARPLARRRWRRRCASPPSPTATSAPHIDEPRAAEARGARGTVVAVWGPGGAPGRTSLAIAIAAELGAAGVYTALGDADTHGASIAPALGLLDEAPGFAAACRLAGAGALTREEFERIGQFHRASRGGFWVLTGLGRPEPLAGAVERAGRRGDRRRARLGRRARARHGGRPRAGRGALERPRRAAPERRDARGAAGRGSRRRGGLRRSDRAVPLPADARRVARADRGAQGDRRRQQGAHERDRPGCGRPGATDPLPVRRHRGCRARSLGPRRLRRGDPRRTDSRGGGAAVRRAGRHPSAGGRAVGAVDRDHDGTTAERAG